MLSQMRDWLDETRTAAVESEGAGSEPAPDLSAGFYQLVEQLTALRHDLKLLTKAARSGDERHEATLVSMQAAIEQFRAIEPKEAEAAEKARRPLVEALIDLDEALDRGRRAIETARQRVLEEASGELGELRQRLDELYQTQPWWRRVLCHPWHAAAKKIYSDRALQTQRGIFDSLLEGYDLIGNRLQRTLAEQAIVRMDCLGRPVDPHSMKVLEVVSDPCRAPGTVVEQLRAGYLWRGKVIRFAEVKAVGQR